MLPTSALALPIDPAAFAATVTDQADPALLAVRACETVDREVKPYRDAALGPDPVFQSNEVHQEAARAYHPHLLRILAARDKIATTIATTSAGHRSSPPARIRYVMNRRAIIAAAAALPVTLPLLPVASYAAPADPAVEAYEEWRKAYRTFLVALKTRPDDDDPVVDAADHAERAAATKFAETTPTPLPGSPHRSASRPTVLAKPTTATTTEPNPEITTSATGYVMTGKPRCAARCRPVSSRSRRRRHDQDRPRQNRPD